ncbi:YbhB/YbcL family Raf kinase inhibitor-like protein [Agitococcus lubricus]|uniref:PBP family phospholipid-binding protein n=1 Tax=Agitococcus lubricus TaxID=1077255 RepID=A0A2T5J1S0_9GAMM|nr:YbhB/YbcL family Raf kinase inhibitor-like protein [Agitococcus lubricus]PTQ90395.1 PBP family phospholipid-binding protein [Agitococcus lubricus]
MLKQLLSYGILASTLISGHAISANFSLSSPSIKANKLSLKQVANSFGCTGENISPALMWQNAPKTSKSYAITVYDPDAPTGSGWWHWVVYNIPKESSQLPEGAGTENSTTLPTGAIQGRTDASSHSFLGACPPVGDKPHRYIFTIHALNVEKLELPSEASAAHIGFMLNAHRIAKASFTATYGR